MVGTYEEHECQDGFCMVATYEEQGCQDGLKPITTRSATEKKGDLGVITSKGGLPDHMRASEIELNVLKSPLKQTSMFRRQERMLRRQEQQRLTKDAKIQRRIWDPGIKSLQDITLRARSNPKLHRRVAFSLARATEARFEDQRLSEGDHKDDMYKLVEVVGTTKVDVPYGNKSVDIMLEVSNLEKKRDDIN
ncbi:hypothetical protein Tco_0898994 [Tanacetum coccineum]